MSFVSAKNSSYIFHDTMTLICFSSVFDSLDVSIMAERDEGVTIVKVRKKLSRQVGTTWKLFKYDSCI